MPNYLKKSLKDVHWYEKVYENDPSTELKVAWLANNPKLSLRKCPNRLGVSKGLYHIFLGNQTLLFQATVAAHPWIRWRRDFLGVPVYYVENS